MKPAETVNSLINCLTNDEDYRQELWAHYLNGNPLSSLSSYLDKISQEESVSLELKSILWRAFVNPPSDKFYKLLSYLSEIERSVACLLALGLTVSEISRYKGISSIRIKQVIAILKENNCWEELYGTEKAINK